MDSRSYEALRKIKTECYIYNDAKDTVRMYNTWAEKYDEDIEAIGYKLPDESAKVLMSNFERTSDKVVLDVLCGTGLVGFYLRRRGFSGMLHGLDGSDGMLKRAADKDVYQTLTRQYLEPSQDDFVQGKLSNLDAVTIVGGFLQAHLNPEVLWNLAELLKRGGFLLFTVRVSEDNECIRKPLEDVTKRMVACGILKKKEIVKTTHGVDWDVEDYDKRDIENKIPSGVYIYCYEKC